MRNPFMQGDSGLLRRIPVAFHMLFVGALLGLFQVVSPQFTRLMISFNDSATLSWETLLIILVLLVGYAKLVSRVSLDVQLVFAKRDTVVRPAVSTERLPTFTDGNLIDLLKGKAVGDYITDEDTIAILAPHLQRAMTQKGGS